MTNYQIYQKTLPFSLLRLLYSTLGLIAAVALPTGAFFLTNGMGEDVCVIVTAIAAILGLVLFILLCRYLGYMLKAGQIAMITKGIDEGELPENVVSAGKEAVKARFTTANVYFVLDSAIRGITNQITRGITGVAGALGSLGGENGAAVAGSIGGAISSFVAVILRYVNDCCLGWVFKNKDQNAFKSTCDGAVIYFQNWKVLLKNAAKVFVAGLLSLIVLGIPLFLLVNAAIQASSGLTALLNEMAVDMETDAEIMRWTASGILSMILWGIVHGAVVSPYILVSILRKYMEGADANPPTFDLYGKLAGLSKRFKDTMGKAQLPGDTAQSV